MHVLIVYIVWNCGIVLLLVLSKACGRGPFGFKCFFFIFFNFHFVFIFFYFTLALFYRTNIKKNLYLSQEMLKTYFCCYG